MSCSRIEPSGLSRCEPSPAASWAVAVDGGRNHGRKSGHAQTGSGPVEKQALAGHRVVPFRNVSGAQTLLSVAQAKMKMPASVEPRWRKKIQG